MYFEAESDGQKFQVTVTESKTHWTVGLKGETADWIYHTIRKEDYMSLDETVSFIFRDSSYLIDVISKGTEYTVYTRGAHKTLKIYNEEKLLHESLKSGGGFGSGANLESGMPGKIVKIFGESPETKSRKAIPPHHGSHEDGKRNACERTRDH